MKTIYFEKDNQLYEFVEIDKNVILPENIKILTKKEFEKKLNKKDENKNKIQTNL